jgi:hypothetical protein
MEIKSPCDGILLHGSKKLEGGELKRGGAVGLHTPFLTVAESGSLSVLFNVQEADVFKVRPGLHAECKPAAKPDMALAAEVDRLAVLPTAGKGWEGTARVEGKRVDLVPGMTAALTVTCKTLENVLVVPRNAVIEEEGKHYCRRVTSEGEEKVEVVKGDANDKVVVIKEGLAEGDEILVEKAK